MIALLVIACAAASVAGFSDIRQQLEQTVTTFSSAKWNQEGPALAADIVNAVFVIKKDRVAVNKFEEQLLDLATPSSANYGKWLSKKEVISQLAPPQGSLNTVLDFIASFNVLEDNIRVSDFQDKVFVKLPVSVAANMLQTEFARFRSLENQKIVLVRVIAPYSLPADVAELVSLVDDIIRLPSIRRSRLTPATGNVTASSSPFDSCGKDCSGFTTPDVLAQAYSYTTGVSSVAKRSSVAVAEFQGQYYDEDDLEAFSKACGVTTDVDYVIGGNKQFICEAGGCVEALLDIEYLGAITNPIPLTTIYSSTYSILDWIDGLIAMSSPPLVNSVSYGNDEVQQTSTEYMQECNTQFMMAGSLGLSILFASGDQGVWGRTGASKGATFHPDFPASSPYVTSVGGTDFAKKSTIGEETTWSCGGGGFSDVFTTPSWQQAEVTAYLAAAKAAGVLPSSKLYNANGRGYPDVSALGGQVNPYCVSVQGGSKFEGVAGTSASTPVVAGIFGQLNNVRLAAGKSPLGWLNPLIYANSQCFQDVNDGSTNYCYKGYDGFAALDGWDPATGFGTPNYACLVKII